MKNLLIVALLLLSTACSAIPLKAHEYRRYRLAYKVDHVEACFSYCTKYKKVLLWDRHHTTNNCMARAETCIDTRDQAAMKNAFGEGWVIIKDNRIL